MSNICTVERAFPASTQVVIGGSLVDAVVAFDLYSFLGLSLGNPQRWFANSLESFGFEESVDYVNPSFPRVDTRDIYVSLGMAKELALVSGTDFGRAYRRHLIQLELDVIHALESRLASAEVIEITSSHYSIREYFNMRGIINSEHYDSRFDAFVLTDYCREYELALEVRPSRRYGVINRYPVAVLDLHFRGEGL